MNNTGTKTAIVVNVEAVIAMPTSFEPTTAASINGAPSSLCRKMFSSTTMPLSTNMPTPNARPPKLTVFNVKPLKYISANVEMTEIGIAGADDQRRREATQEDQQDDDRQYGAGARGRLHVVDGGEDKIRRIHRLFDLDVRVIAVDAVDLFPDSLGDFDGVRARLLGDDETHRLLAVHADEVADVFVRVLDGRDVAARRRGRLRARRAQR